MNIPVKICWNVHNDENDVSFEAKRLIYPFAYATWLLCLSTNLYGLTNYEEGHWRNKSDKPFHKNGVLKCCHFAHSDAASLPF